MARCATQKEIKSVWSSRFSVRYHHNLKVELQTAFRENLHGALRRLKSMKKARSSRFSVCGITAT